MSQYERVALHAQGASTRSSSPPSPTSTSANFDSPAAPSTTDGSSSLPPSDALSANNLFTSPFHAESTLPLHSQIYESLVSTRNNPATIPHSALPILTRTPHSREPSSAGLRLETDFSKLATPSSGVLPPGSADTPTIVEHRSGEGLAGVVRRSSLLHNSNHYSSEHSGLNRRCLSTASMASSLSPGSALSSPALNALADITPLPSPMILGDSPGPWRRGSTSSRPASQGSLTATGGEALTWLPTGSVSRQSSKKNKSYGSLSPAAEKAYSGAHARAVEQKNSGHARNRSVSEYVPEGLHNTRPRNVTISGPQDETPTPTTLHREKYLAEQRGLTKGSQPATTIPTPPSSNKSMTGSEEEEMREEDILPEIEYLTVQVDLDNRPKKKMYRPIRQLGQGTFSKVMLCTSEHIPTKDIPDESLLDPKKLVAIKIVEHGPAGGADEERVKLSLKREVEMLRSVSHPSLVHLSEFSANKQHALLVLNYCAGGDLFDLASVHQKLLSAELVQRIFAELVSAVGYLHSHLIVHRDIKLENVLLNVSHDALPPNPRSHTAPLVTLTDLGLSRRIPAPPASPLLTTRCGSEDYAAPEILLGQPYDGRATDAWALGVLLYALMEGRLPFDPPPGGVRGAARSRGRTAHRVARCEWGWWKFGDDDGEWSDEKLEQDPKAELWLGARTIVEGLLKKVTRGRLSLEAVAESEWVKGGIEVDGGLLGHPADDLISDKSVAELPDVEGGAEER